MVLMQRQCQRILETYRQEVRQNPDADYTPYVKKIEALFRRAERTFEKNVLNTLFLNFYALDATALRKDLCALNLQGLGLLKPDNTEREKLILGLYGALPLYVRDFEAMIEHYQELGGVNNPALLRKKKEMRNEFGITLAEFRAYVRQERDGNILHCINRLLSAAGFPTMERNCEQRIISSLFWKLYGDDVHAIRKDWGKAAWNDSGKDAMTFNRTDLLPYLCIVLAPFILEDFSSVFELCDKVEAMK